MKKILFLLPAILMLGFSMTCAAPTPQTPPQTADLETMIGQMLMVGFRGVEVNASSPIIRDIREHHLGSVILFDYDVTLHNPIRNITSPEQVQHLVTALKNSAQIPLLVAVDQEGGRVTRLKEKYGFPPTLSAAELGRQDSFEATQKAGQDIGTTLAEAGINWDLAPVVDVNINPDCPAIGKLDRSFAADPKVVVTQAGALITGLHSRGILSCLKHFPGHGSSMADSHMGLTDVSATWSPEELIPYKRLIETGLCDAVMSAHIFNTHLDPTFPATLSAKVLTGLLRQKLGFTGVILTDDMQMGAIRKHYGFKQSIAQAIMAGADILVFGNNLQYDPDIAAKAVTAIKELVRSGEIPRSRIEASFDRIMKLKAKL